MSTLPRKIKVRFWAWVIFMSAMLGVFATLVVPRLKVETDILALLPNTRSDAATTQAVNRFSQNLAGKIIILIGAPQLEQAKQAAHAFADSLRTSKSFSEVTLEQNATGASMLSVYWPHRDYLLSSRQRELLTQDKGAVVLQEAMHAAFTPAGLMRPVSLAQDPLGLATDYLLQQLPSVGAAQLDGNLLIIPDDGNTGINYVLIAMELAGSPFASQTQDDSLAAIDAARAAAAKSIAPNKFDMVMSGTLQHAAAARDRATTELNVFGSIETVSIIFLLVLVFNAVRPLVLGAMTTGLAFVGGLCATHFVFGTVHVLALVFGSSLIGGVIDYSIHFFADRFRSDENNWTPVIAVEHVGGSIVLGLATTLLSYVVLLMVPFPGLRQIALFCVAGLATGCLSVICAYPVLYKAPRTLRSWGPRIGEKLNEYFQRWQWSSMRIAAGMLLLVIALFGITRAHIQDDVRALQSSPPELIAAEQRVAGLLKSGIESRYFLVQAASEQGVLENEERLTTALNELKASSKLSGYNAVTRSLPSIHLQQLNHQALQTQVLNQNGLMSQMLQQLGFSSDDVQKRVTSFAQNTTPLNPGEWAASDAARPYKDLWLGELNGKFTTIVMLAGVKDVEALRQIAATTPGVQLIDRVNAVSDVLRSYRQAMSLLLCVVYAAAWLMLGFKYGWKASPLLLLPSALASAVTIGLFGWFGVPVNLFTLLALWLVLGLGVDYGIFLRHGHTAMATAVLSVTLSASTTLLAFGLLAFSATPFIRSIGLTLLCSITLSWLFAMLGCLTVRKDSIEGERS